MRTAISAVIIEDRKILLVRKKQTWILPGGQRELGESDIECLCRESDEELSGTKIENFIYYKDFFGVTPHKKDLLRDKVYFAKIKDELHSPSSEIEEVGWVGDSSNYNLSDITSKIINDLKQEGYL